MRPPGKPRPLAALTRMIVLPEPLDVPKTGRDFAGSSYAYRASLIGAAHRFELTDAGLSWHFGGKSGIWPYVTIVSIRLSYRPMSMQSRRFRADVENTSGQRIAVFSTTWQTIALMAPQDRDYRAFVTQLHRRLAQAGSKAVLSGGLRPGTYIAALVLLALVALALAGLLVRAIATGEFGGVLFLIGFAALSAWQIGGFIRRNRPRSYGVDDLPDDLLP
jgi:hypothetical protein